MIEAFDMYLSEATKAFDLIDIKLDAIMEAASRELEINFKEAQLKVMKEHGTDDDLAYLIEAANNGFVETVVKAIEKIKEAIIKFFSTVKSKIIDAMTSKEHRETINKIEKKLKIFPFLGKKKIIVENYDAEEKCAMKYMSMLAKLKAKLKAGHHVSTDDIDDVEEGFLEEHGKLIGVAAAATITVAAGLTILKKMGDNAKSTVNENEKYLKEICAEGKALASKVDNPAVAERLVSAYTTIVKTNQNDFVRSYKTTGMKIKEAMRAAKNTKVDLEDLTESTDDALNSDAPDTEDINTDDLDKAAVSEDGEGEDPIENMGGDDDNDPWDDVIDDMNDKDDSHALDDEPSFESVYNSIFGESASENSSGDDKKTGNNGMDAYSTLLESISSIM